MNNQYWDSKGKVHYLDDNGNEIKNNVPLLKQVQNNLQAFAFNADRWLNETNPESKAYKQKADAAITLMTLPLGAGAKATQVIAKPLVPYVGKQIAKTTAQGVGAGALGGGIQGVGTGLIEGENPVVTGLLGVVSGGAFGGLAGLGAGKFAQKMMFNNLYKNQGNKQVFDNYFDNYIDGLKNKSKPLADYRAAKIGTKPAGSDILYQKAYHGSPAEFEKFDNSFINTGEGAQAHGHGHYAALNKDVAHGYRTGLALRNNAEESTINGKPLSKLYDNLYEQANRTKDNKLARELYDRTAMLEDLMLHKDPEEVLSTFSSADFNYSPETLNWYKNEIMPKLKEPGSLFELDIPENYDLIREDLPYNKQPKKIQQALAELFSKEKIPITEDMMSSGSNIYGNIKNHLYGQNSYYNPDFNGAKAASELLDNYGIKGISYNGGQDGEAFVIFNPDNMKIMRKFYTGENTYNKIAENRGLARQIDNKEFNYKKVMDNVEKMKAPKPIAEDLKNEGKIVIMKGSEPFKKGELDRVLTAASTKYGKNGELPPKVLEEIYDDETKLFYKYKIYTKNGKIKASKQVSKDETIFD